ncbi:MAG: response regulator [Deltaproteobacteria bacterium]|jgi:DNA-binding NtrC family response regulator|nr:MAG: response regulator [Deltaproteobacteria bacterium]
MSLPVLLVIDDEYGVRESLKIVFSKDYRVLEADSIDAAIPQVQEAHPDVVLLDVLMPKADGLEVLRRVKQIHSGCEVIMLTGVNSQQLAAKAMDSGAFDFIGKPFDVVVLRQKVSRALAQVIQKSGSSSA